MACGTCHAVAAIRLVARANTYPCCAYRLGLWPWLLWVWCQLGLSQPTHFRWSCCFLRRLPDCAVHTDHEPLPSHGCLGILSASDSQTTGPLGSLAPVIGVYGIGFVLLISTLSLLSIFRPVSPASRIAALGIVAGVTTCSVWASATSFTTPKSQALGVRMTQASIAQTVKFDPDRLKRSLDEYIRLSIENLPDNIHLVVWPETAIPTRFNRVENYLKPTISALDARDIDVLAGGFDRVGEASYNAVRQLGGAQQVYRKRHLVPFGEYVPLRGFIELFSDFIQIPGTDIARGDGPHVPLDVAGESIGVSTLLVNVSNDAWFGEAVAPYQHEQKARMRARELGRPLIRVTNTGISSAITHTGEIIGRIPQGVSDYLDVMVTPRTGTTPYARTGNLPVQVVALLLVIAACIRHRRLSQTRS